MKNSSSASLGTNNPNQGLDAPDALGVIGGVLCILTLWVIVFVGHTKSIEQVVYVFLFGIVPVLAVSVVGWMLPRISLTTPIVVGKIFIATVLLVSSALVFAELPH